MLPTDASKQPDQRADQIVHVTGLWIGLPSCKRLRPTTERTIVQIQTPRPINMGRIVPASTLNTKLVASFSPNRKLPTLLRTANKKKSGRTTAAATLIQKGSDLETIVCIKDAVATALEVGPNAHNKE
jgi:hypothetical protein